MIEHTVYTADGEVYIIHNNTYSHVVDIGYFDEEQRWETHFTTRDGYPLCLWDYDAVYGFVVWIDIS